MSTIVFASSKGGSGKSTSALTLALELVQTGTTVTIIDSDPNTAITQWRRRGGTVKGLSLVTDVTEKSISNEIASAAMASNVVIVDLEGRTSKTMTLAIAKADLVIIPTQGSQLDATEATKVINLVCEQERWFGRRIGYQILFTRTSAALRPRTLQLIQDVFNRYGVPAFRTQMHEREAFRAIFSYGGTLRTLDREKVSNIDGAIANAEGFAHEVLDALRAQSADNLHAKVA